MADSDELTQTLINAFAWTGVFAVAYTVMHGIVEIAVFAAAVILSEFAIRRIFGTTAKPKHHSHGGTLVFQITPLKYPKILDADANAFAPEFIKLDIFKDGARLFSGDVARDTVKHLREMLDSALSPTTTPTQAEASRKQRAKA